jgi:hypothetical protein
VISPSTWTTSLQVEEVLRRIESARVQPTRDLVELGEDVATVVGRGGARLLGQREAVQQIRPRRGVERRRGRPQPHGRSTVVGQVGRLSEHRGGDRTRDMRVEERERLPA